MRYVSALLVGSLLFLAGCIPRGGNPTLAEFSFSQGSCGAGEETAAVAVEPGALLFSGEFSAPTPCHGLKAVLQRIASQHQIVLSLVAEPAEEPCVQCLALNPYSGRIEGLAGGLWHVRIYHEDRLVLQGDFDVPPPG